MSAKVAQPIPDAFSGHNSVMLFLNTVQTSSCIVDINNVGPFSGHESIMLFLYTINTNTCFVSL